MKQIGTSKDIDFDAILAHYQSEEETQLTPFQQQKLKIWETAHDLLKDHMTPTKVWPMLSKRFPNGDKELSRAQCYRHIKMADKLFSRNSLLSMETTLGILLEKNWESYKRAIDRKDSKAEAMLLRNIDNISTKLKDIEDKAGNEISFVQINIVADPDAIGLPKIENLEAKIKSLQAKRARKSLEAEEIDYV